MRPASVAIILIFWIIYTGGSCNDASIEDHLVAECKRQSVGTQAYAFCDCGNRPECKKGEKK